MSLNFQGCYLAKQGRGQLNVRLNQVSLEQAIDAESRTHFRTLLAAVPKIKDFAISKIGLRQNQNYTTYYETPKPAITFVVTASKKTELEPHTWWFPILGSVPYKGFFERKDALNLEKDLQSQGYDTWVFEAVAYSTLGWFKDPITTPMLRRGYFNLAETIIHEMTHATLYIKDQGRFNEQLASFVAQKGAFQYFREFNILSEETLGKIEEKQNRKKAFSLLVKNTIPKLEKLYSSEIPDEEKLQEREKIFTILTNAAKTVYPARLKANWQFNNARILQYRRYESDAVIFKKIWQESEQQWDRFWVNIKNYAKAKFNYSS